MKEKYNVLVVGSGAREFAICKKLMESPSIKDVYCAPGNPGMKKIGVKVTEVNEDQLGEIAFLARDCNAKWTLIGPETAIDEGIVDLFRRLRLRVIGPTTNIAKLETSKSFALDFMEKYEIPAPQYDSYNDRQSVLRGLQVYNFPLVIKKDGLAGGKGVYIAHDQQEALKILDNLVIDEHHRIVLEEYLEGQEFSFFTLLNRKSYQVLPVAQDHKKAYEKDQGPNTGGMGAYSPTPQLTPKQYEEVVKKVIEPTMKGVRKLGAYYTGFLYIGIILTADGPKVIEYNVRLGDPEAQVILPRIKNDFADVLTKAVFNEEISPLKISSEMYVNIVLAVKNYPQAPLKGQELPEFKVSENVEIEYANVLEKNGKLYGDGGRILSVVGHANNLYQARRDAYRVLAKNPVENTYYRKDIANKGF